MAHEYRGGSQPIQVVYVQEVTFRSTRWIASPGRKKRASLVLTIQRNDQREPQNLSFRPKDAAVLAQAVTLTLRDAGQLPSQPAPASNQSASRELRPESPSTRRRRRRRTLSLEALIEPGIRVRERAGDAALDDPGQVEPEVKSFVEQNLNRILEPLRAASVAAELLVHVRSEVSSMIAVLVTALHETYGIHAEPKGGTGNEQ